MTYNFQEIVSERLEEQRRISFILQTVKALKPKQNNPPVISLHTSDEKPDEYENVICVFDDYFFHCFYSKGNFFYATDKADKVEKDFFYWIRIKTE